MRFPVAMRSPQRSSASCSGEQAASQRRRAFGTLSMIDLPDGGAFAAIEVVDPFPILQVKVA
jgi:hypothetical protein